MRLTKKRSKGKFKAYIGESRILAITAILGHLVVDPEGGSAYKSRQEGKNKEEDGCPLFRLRLVLQGADDGVKAVHVEPDEHVDGGVDEEDDAAVEQVADGGAVHHDNSAEGAEREEQTDGKVGEGKTDDVQVEPLEKSNY